MQIPAIAAAASATFILYVLFGYPAWLALAARRRRRPIRRHLDRKTVSIILPVRNGERWIAAKLRSILALNYPRELVEVIVISDGSEDRTDEIVRGFSPGVQLLPRRRAGKAEALNAGIERARGEILFFTDVRQELDPDSLPNLVACLGDPEVGVASGELVILEGQTREEANVGLYWRYEKWIRKNLSRLDSVLGATGCIYAMRRELAVPLPSDTLLDDVHQPLAAFFRGYRVVLDETAKAYDYPTSLDTEFRRKVRTLAGVYQVMRAYPGLLGPANRMWIHFVSHKLGRLLLPWALLLLLVASFGLPAPWAPAALGAQGVFYAIALLDAVVPERWPLKRISSPARTFVVLMAAALCAVSIFFLPARTFWKETRVGAARTVSS